MTERQLRARGPMWFGETSGRNEAEIARVVEPHCETLGYELVRVRLSGGRAPTLQIMAERLDGRAMGLEDCTALSRHLSAVLDVADPLPGTYMLEISSPGLDRPLVKRGDFERFRGREAKIELDRPIDGRRRFRGRLGGLAGEAVRVDLGAGEVVELPLEAITSAKLVLNDEALASAGKEERV